MMVLEKLNHALELTLEMRKAFQDGDLDQVEELSVQRDKILHECGDDTEGRERNREQVSDIVGKIIQLNNEMIELGQKEKTNIRSDMEKEIRGSSHVKKYIDNMK